MVNLSLLAIEKTQNMAPGERFLTALRGGIPDQVPVFEHLFAKVSIKFKNSV